MAYGAAISWGTSSPPYYNFQSLILRFFCRQGPAAAVCSPQHFRSAKVYTRFVFLSSIFILNSFYYFIFNALSLLYLTSSVASFFSVVYSFLSLTHSKQRYPSFDIWVCLWYTVLPKLVWIFLSMQILTFRHALAFLRVHGVFMCQNDTERNLPPCIKKI